MEDNLDLWGRDDFDELPEKEEEEKEPGFWKRLFHSGRKGDNQEGASERVSSGTRGEDGSAGAAGWNETEHEGDESHAGAAGKRRFMMAAMLTVLGMAGGILGIVIAQSVQTNQQLEEQKSKDERMQQQLEQIEGYLSGLDQSVSDGQVTDAESYEELSSTVQTLQGNLQYYRDNNTIQNDAIGENLDGVILELAAIQENLEANQKAQEEMNGDLSSDVTTNVASSVDQSVNKSSQAISASIDEQVSGVREDIRKLIQEASSDNKNQYKELVSILNGTDTDLGSLSESIKALSAENDEMKKTMASGLDRVSGSVAGVRNGVSGIQEGVSALQSGVGTLEKSLGKLESQGTVDSSALKEMHSSLAMIETKSAELQEQTTAMTAYLNANGAEFSAAADEITEVRQQVEAIGSKTVEVQKALDSMPAELKKDFTGDPETLDQVLQKSEEMENLRTTTADLSATVTEIGQDVNDLQNTLQEEMQDGTMELSELSGKVDLILEKVEKLSARETESRERENPPAGGQQPGGTGSDGSPSGGAEDHPTVPEQGGNQETSEDHTANDLSGTNTGGKDPE